MKFFNLFSFFILSLFFQTQATAQAVSFTQTFSYNSINGTATPAEVFTNLNTAYKDFGGKGTMFVFDGVPTRETINATIFGQVPYGRFFLAAVQKDPILFNLEYGYIGGGSFAFDKVTVAEGDYKSYESTEVALPRTQVKYDCEVDYFPLPTVECDRVKQAYGFLVDVSRVYQNSAKAYTKLVIVRFYTGNTIAKTLVLPITVVGKYQQYLGDGPGPRELSTILRAVPGDGSKSFINKSQSTSSEVTMSVQASNATSTTNSVKVEAGISAGPISASASLEASQTTSYEATQGKENTYNVTYTAAEQIENNRRFDLFITSQYLCQFGVEYTVQAFHFPSLPNMVGIIPKSKILLYPLRIIEEKNYYEDELINKIIPRLQREKKLKEAKFWQDALAYNNQIKNEVSIKRTSFGKNSGVKSFAATRGTSVSLSQEIVIANSTSTKVTVGAGFEVGPVSASTEASQETTATFTSTRSSSNTQGGTKSMEVGYQIADDDDDDELVVDIFEELVFGTPVFKLDESRSATSCPYEGGTSLDQLSISVQDPVTLQDAKTAKLSDVALDGEATFNITLKNNNTAVARPYKLSIPYPTDGLLPMITILGVGDYPIEKEFTIAPGGTQTVILKVKNSLSKAQGFKDIEVLLESACDESISDAVFVSVFYGDSDTNRAPDNDLACSAVELSVDGSIVRQYLNKFGNLANLSNINATAALSEAVLTPLADCDNGWCPETVDNLAQINNSVWFSFVTKSPSVLISLCDNFNAPFNSQLAAYTVGDCNDISTFNLVGANDDGCGLNSQSSRLFLESLPIGATYYVLVDGFNGAQSDFNISITSPAPENDDACALEFLEVNGLPNQGAAALGRPGFHYSNNLATVEDGEQILTPLSNDPLAGWKADDIQHSVWFAFAAPDGGSLIIDVKNATFDTQVSLYGTDGNICGPVYFSTYTLLGANDEVSLAGGLDSRLKVSGLIPGKRYLILVDGYQGETGTFDIVLSATPPTNDDPCNAIAIATDGESKGIFRNGGASSSLQEQILAPPYNEDGANGWTDIADDRAKVIEKSVWFKFIAPSSGKVQISTCAQADFQVQLALYQVGNCNDFSTFQYITAEDNSNLCPEPPSSDYPNGRNIRGSIINVENLQADSTYYILVDGGIQGYGTFSMTITVPPSSPPANDEVCDAIALPTDGSIQTGFTNVGATITELESVIAPTNIWNDARLNSSVWFTFVAPASGEVEISTCDMANFDSQIAVYTAASCEDISIFELIAANEDGPDYCATQGDNLLPITGLTAGNTYYLVVDGYASFTGNFSISIKDKITPGPANDQVANAIVLPVDGVVQTGFTNYLATATVLEQSIKPTASGDCINGWCDNQVDNSVWFKFVAPASGKVTISTCDLASFDTQLALYTATDVNNFSTFALIAANDAGPVDCATYFDSYLPVTNLIAGQTYYVMVDGFNGDSGNFNIVASTEVVSATDNIDISSQFAVYPNPFKEQLTVVLPTTNRLDYELQLVDLDGRVLMSRMQNSTNTMVQMDVSAIPSGLFILSIRSEKGVFSKKLIKY